MGRWSATAGTVFENPLEGKLTHWSLEILFLAAIPATVFAYAIYTLPLSAYVQDLNVDDSFYYYSVARNFAQGHFSSYDGIIRTNGYHPLWALLLTPVFIFTSDPVAALRLAKIEELALLALAVALIGSAGRAAGFRFATLCIIPMWLFGKAVFFNGLEVATQTILLAMLLALLTRVFLEPGRKFLWVAVALVCALLPWARLECLAISVAVALLMTIFARQQPSVRHFALIIWAATLTSAIAYFAYNKAMFGTPVPVSGQIKAVWSAARFNEEGYNILTNALAIIRRRVSINVAILVCLLIVVASWLSPTYRRPSFAANHGIDAWILILAIAHISRTAFSAFSLHPLYDESWYYIPGLLLLALAGPLLLNRGFLLWRLAVKQPRLELRRHENLAGVAAALFTLWYLNPLALIEKGHGDWRNDWVAASYHGVQWTNAHLPDNAIIGSADSGIVGYFSTHRVVNLDGLMNSSQFLTAVKDQSVEAWIKRSGIDYFGNAMWTEMGGCQFMAKASGQTASYAGPCSLIHDGPISWVDRWGGKERSMRFRVFRFGESQ
jgi:hypothetical protein